MPDSRGGDREAIDRQHFDSIARAYTRKDEAASSRIARRFRLHATIGATGLPDEFTALEVGCGTGYAAEYLGERLVHYVGVDHSSELISIARIRHAGPRHEFHVGRAQDLDFDAQFDLAFVIGVLHHLEGVEDAVGAMFDALRPGGWVAVNEPQPNNPVIRAARRLRKRVDATYSDDQVEFRADQLRSMLVAAGFDRVETYPQGYVSTPFAEVPLPFPRVTAPLSTAAVRVDTWLGSRRWLPGLAWNCIAVGQKPD
jgi:SAM-dependent methyltransferase